MQERIRELLNKILAWWKALSVKQRTIIVCVSAAVVLAFVVLISVLSRPQYTLLATCETTKEAAQITELLDGQDMTYEVSDDGLQIRILSSQLSEANLLLGANDIQASAYGIENVTSGGFSTTESDKQKRHIVYLEKRLENDFIGMFPAIEKATVMLHIPDNDGTLISSDQSSYASIVLELKGDFSTDSAAFLAKAVATQLGNDNAENITIMDTDGNMLYSGSDDYSLAGSATSQMNVKQQAEAIVASQVKRVLLGTNGFDNIEVASNLDIDFSTKDITNHDYSSDENSTQGLLAEANIYNSDSTAGGGDVPGTDSNDEGTTYVIQDNENQSTTVTEESYKYLPDENITKTSIPAGSIKYDTSSIAVTAIDYVVIKEEDAKKQGLLDGISWDEYKAANSERTRMTVDDDVIDVVAKATGIAAENISMIAYSENWFVDKEGLNVGTSDIIVFVLIALILGLLAFVILRSMMKERTPEEPVEELSIETLLQSQPESDLEDIELESKSETRKLIEKFVDENPEAVAALLRNWLNEDWG